MFKVFISHAFDHTPLYDSIVVRMNRDRFNWYDCSVPRNRRYGVDGQPLPDEAMKTLLADHINRCDVVVAIAKPIATTRPWLRWEIEYAKSIGKPIVAVWRRQVDVRVSSFVLSRADATVDSWNIRTIIRCIKETVRTVREQAASSSLATSHKQTLPDIASIPVDDPEMIPLVSAPNDVLAPIEELGLTQDEVVHAVAQTALGGIASPLGAGQPLREKADRIPVAHVIGSATSTVGDIQSPKQALLENVSPAALARRLRWWQFWRQSDPPN